MTKIEALDAIDAWFDETYGQPEVINAPAGPITTYGQDLDCPDVGLNGAGDKWLARCTYNRFSSKANVTPLLSPYDLRVEIDAYTGHAEQLP